MISYNPFSLEGKTILIAGASGGIGRATAVECARLGARVILSARNETALKDTLSLLEGKEHCIMPCDMTSNDDKEQLASNCPELDGIVYAAGISKLKPIQAIRPQDLQEVFDVNTFAPILLTRQMIKAKKLHNGASVILISSISGNGNTAVGLTAYGSSKAALTSFANYAALEFSSRNIRVNTVLPGRIETELINSGSLSSVDREQDLQKYPLHRYGEPAEVAQACCYLLSDATKWMTGTSIKLDGGRSLI